jgi:four helix bundle protein
MEGSFKDLIVYRKAYALATKIYELSKTFPKEEKYSLTSQIRNSSRSVCANLAEAYRKRKYPKHFTSKITDADGEASETSVWIDFAFACRYIDEASWSSLQESYGEVGRILGKLANNPEKFLP